MPACHTSEHGGEGHSVTRCGVTGMSMGSCEHGVGRQATGLSIGG